MKKKEGETTEEEGKKEKERKGEKRETER